MMGDIFNTLKETPVPILLILAGLFFTLLTFVNKIGIIEVSPNQQRSSMFVGLILLTIGLILDFTPTLQVREVNSASIESTPTANLTPTTTPTLTTVQSVTPPSAITPTPTPTPLDTPSIVPTPNLSRENAVILVEGWLRAKSDIFAAPFDRELLAKYVHSGGALYRDSINSMNWLNSNNSYYTYAVSAVADVWLFSSSTDRPTLKVRVEETRTLHTPRGIDHTQSGSTPHNVTYIFAKEDGIWKIYNYLDERN